MKNKIMSLMPCLAISIVLCIASAIVGNQMQDFREHFIPDYLYSDIPSHMTVVEVLSDSTALLYGTDYSAAWATTIVNNATQNPDAIKACIIMDSYQEMVSLVINGQLIPVDHNGWIDLSTLYTGDTIVTADDIK